MGFKLTHDVGVIVVVVGFLYKGNETVMFLASTALYFTGTVKLVGLSLVCRGEGAL